MSNDNEITKDDEPCANESTSPTDSSVTDSAKMSDFKQENDNKPMTLSEAYKQCRFILNDEQIREMQDVEIETNRHIDLHDILYMKINSLPESDVADLIKYIDYKLMIRQNEALDKDDEQ